MYLPITDSRVQFLLVIRRYAYSLGNYYLALGFLGGKEAQAAKIGNLGLADRKILFNLIQFPNTKQTQSVLH